ncbi:lymphocyte antigen 6 complex locus protein G6f-like isoform X2 [Varanus komodoensis]|uniref:lymphocyte antigen 6 complex locus protein G6f-like isoform X2 n=1 Tax=Varanus komodoensis TaxID=61221 RepID=UPI001CF76AC2|nr:lymphocyte antigen 6 complex locus protein G6f-like isoform X2 [Varanus komodoensis]
MGGVSQSSIAIVGALTAIFLSLRLSGAETVYAKKGSSQELKCLCRSCSGESVSWLYDLQGVTTTLFKLQNAHIKRFAAWDRLQMLTNYSLHLSNVTDKETGRYWCSWKSYYDLVVVTGKKQILESAQLDTVCYVLSCSVSVKEIIHSAVSWWEGKKQLQEEDKKERYSTFSGPRTTQLQICLAKEVPGKKAKERNVKCCFGEKTEKMEIAFSLSGKDGEICTGDSSKPFPEGAAPGCSTPQCPDSGGHGWVLLVVCVTLQFLVILTLAAALLRRRCRRRHKDHLRELSKETSKSEYVPQVYENVRT